LLKGVLTPCRASSHRRSGGSTEQRIICVLHKWYTSFTLNHTAVRCQRAYTAGELKSTNSAPQPKLTSCYYSKFDSGFNMYETRGGKYSFTCFIISY